MNLRPKSDNKAEVFTAAMNDIMFFLMLFFIIMSTLLNPNIINLNLPTAKHSETARKKEINLSINKDAEYFIDNRQVNFSEIESILLSEKKKKPDAIVIVRCDNTIQVQQLVEVLEIGTKLNMKMLLATKRN